MTLTGRKPADLAGALDLLRNRVDAAHQRALHSVAYSRGGVPKLKTQGQISDDMIILEVLLSLLEDLDPRYGVTEAALKSESRLRIDGDAIRTRDERERAQLVEQKGTKR